MQELQNDISLNCSDLAKALSEMVESRLEEVETSITERNHEQDKLKERVESLEFRQRALSNTMED